MLNPMDFATKVTWGPPAWRALHSAAELADRGTLDFTRSTKDEFSPSIPCPACKAHFIELLRAAPRKRKESFLAWTVRLHNRVNERLGYPIATYGVVEPYLYATDTVLICRKNSWAEIRASLPVNELS